MITAMSSPWAATVSYVGPIIGAIGRDAGDFGIDLIEQRPHLRRIPHNGVLFEKADCLVGVGGLIDFEPGVLDSDGDVHSDEHFVLDDKNGK
jgi:hypothetical protein